MAGSCTCSIRITGLRAVGRRRDGAGVAGRDDRAGGPQTIAAFILETVTGTNGILIPPDGYLQGVRELCTRYGILMIADEMMAGFGRTGEWFAVEPLGRGAGHHDDREGPDVAYVPLGAVGMRAAIADALRRQRVLGRAHVQHAIRSASPRPSRRSTCYEEDDLIGNAKRMGAVMRAHHEELAATHPSVGRTPQHRAVRRHRAGEESRDDGAAVAVQRAERRRCGSSTAPCSTTALSTSSAGGTS